VGGHPVFSDDFATALRHLVALHHHVYPGLPPQGIYFEALAERAFKDVRIPFTRVAVTTPNVPKHDIEIGDARVSLKTETGKGTKEDRISITKLCTTEREPWDAPTLVARAVAHLARYDYMLMLRAIWRQAVIRYQIVDIPLALLRLIGAANVRPVGRRRGRPSVAGDVYSGEVRVFHVHFDGADGKCQVRDLMLNRCGLILEWAYQIQDRI